MYHRVLPSRDITRAVQPGMVVQPETLACHFEYLKRNFDVVPLAHLKSASFGHSAVARTKPLCAITFDDGWYDFFLYANPIIKNFRLPVTVFLPTDFIGTDRWPWPDQLGYLLDRIGTNVPTKLDRESSTNPLVSQILHQFGTGEARLERAISLLKSRRLEEIDVALAGLSEAAGTESGPANRAFFSWDEAKEMAESGLVSYGSHTAGHPILTTLLVDEARSELARSRDALISRGLMTGEFMPFCYPNGDYSDRLMDLVRETGYHMAVTTRRGWNRFGEDLYCLRRVGLHQDVSESKSMFASRIAGLA